MQFSLPHSTYLSLFLPLSHSASLVICSVFAIRFRKHCSCCGCCRVWFLLNLLYCYVLAFRLLSQQQQQQQWQFIHVCVFVSVRYFAALQANDATTSSTLDIFWVCSGVGNSHTQTHSHIHLHWNVITVVRHIIHAVRNSIVYKSKYRNKNAKG